MGSIIEYNSDFIDPKNPEEYFGDEVGCYCSPNIEIKKLQVSNMDYDTFVANFSNQARSNIADDYSLLKRNCAHLANQALNVIYGYAIPMQNKLGLLPGTVFKAAEAKILSGPTKIKDYDFARMGMRAVLKRIEEYTKTFKDRIEFKNAKRAFLDSTKAIPLSDKTLTDAFTKLGENMAKIEETYRNSRGDSVKFRGLKDAFYGFIRIFAKDPLLEDLRDFKKVMETVKQVGLIKQEKPSAPQAGGR